MDNVYEQLKKTGYRAVVGLEVHVQLNTASKIFSSDPNDFSTEPNSNVSAVSVGHPGTLPVLNTSVLEKAIRMGLACNSKISRINHFARKNYFYPDLPKGYQITQDKTPICTGGRVALFAGSLKKETVKLHHIHLEEDAGKSIHDEGPDTLIDLNRAGTPLIEIVTEPDIHHADEAVAFLQEIRRLIRYLEISGGNMENGEMRCDANISIMPVGSTVLGNKVEVKNMNSINNVRKAINHELGRQLRLVEKEEAIVVETRTFDPSDGTTAGMRFKETMNDYRYFPDPDLAPVIIGQPFLEKISKELPDLPDTFRKKFRTAYRLPDYDIGLLTEEKETALFFDALCQRTSSYKSAANWLNGPVKSLLNENKQTLKESNLSVEGVEGLIRLVEDGKVSYSMASQRILPEMLNSKCTPAELAESLNLLMLEDENDLLAIVREVLGSLPDKVRAYKKGKKGLTGLFIGEVMKKSQGKANPKKVKQLIEEELQTI